MLAQYKPWFSIFPLLRNLWTAQRWLDLSWRDSNFTMVAYVFSTDSSFLRITKSEGGQLQAVLLLKFYHFYLYSRNLILIGKYKPWFSVMLRHEASMPALEQLIIAVRLLSNLKLEVFTLFDLDWRCFNNTMVAYVVSIDSSFLSMIPTFVGTGRVNGWQIAYRISI